MENLLQLLAKFYTSNGRFPLESTEKERVTNRNRFAKHLESHFKPEISDVEMTPISPKLLEEKDTTFDTEPVNEPKPKRQKSERKECPICKKVMDVRSLLRHQRDIHKEIVPTNVCVDEMKGLYMVRKGGVAYPVHVQKCVRPLSDVNGKQTQFCENYSCRVYMEVACRSGMNAVECQHIREVGVNTTYKEEVHLQESDLNGLSQEGTFNILKQERIKQCISLSKAASSNNAVLIVSFEDGERYIHFSVYDGAIHYYSKLGRVIVTCNLKNGYLDCGCCHHKRGCTHKAICLWYLHGIDKLEQFRGVVEDDDDELGVPKQEQLSDVDQICEQSKLFYPPADKDTVANMCKYLKDHTKFPLSANQDKSKAIPRRYTPVEKEWLFCNIRLSKPIRITTKATVVTMDSITTNVETYFSKCESCGMCFRYQEYTEGVHNYNDTFLIGLDVCIHLRDSLQCHIPIGSATERLERSLKTKPNGRTIFNTLFFISMP
ncbi:Hypothetical predicted protein [Paramuricea clavata]|uniref:HMG domain-containing protein n=1 Tax=Paramuricea clavata TaxID=317549 RepID=A0A6S7FPL2_PARCT|nr:Hypothetical predicted protein [Paramuricea clavata]